MPATSRRGRRASGAIRENTEPHHLINKSLRARINGASTFCLMRMSTLCLCTAGQEQTAMHRPSLSTNPHMLAELVES